MELAGYNANACRLNKVVSRPPAILTSTLGITNRIMANALKQSFGVKGLACHEKAVPGLGSRKLTGTESTLRSDRAKKLSLLDPALTHPYRKDLRSIDLNLLFLQSSQYLRDHQNRG